MFSFSTFSFGIVRKYAIQLSSCLCISNFTITITKKKKKSAYRNVHTYTNIYYSAHSPWGISVADYIKCYAYFFLPKLVIFTTIEILLPYLCLS